MKCPICGNELEIKNKQIGTDNSGDPVFNEYAVCLNCKKQWNLDKQRAKKAAAKASAKKAENTDNTDRKKAENADNANRKKAGNADNTNHKKIRNENSDTQKKAENKNGETRKKPENANTGARKNSTVTETSEKASDRMKSSSKSSAPKPKRKPTEKSADEKTVRIQEHPEKKTAKKHPSSKQSAEKIDPNEDKRYSNIPPERVRTKREKAIRKGYEDMLATGALDTDNVKKASSKPSKNKNDKYDTKASRKMPEPEIDEYEDDYYDSVPRFRAMRIILGIVSLCGFGFFTYKGFMTGLSGTTDGGGTSGTLYIILALCMLVSSLLYFIMQKSNTIFAFLLPMLFYLGSGVFAFLKRGDDLQLLIAAVASGILAIISLILAITSRGGSDYDDEEETYDEAFEDDYAEEEYDD